MGEGGTRRGCLLKKLKLSVPRDVYMKCVCERERGGGGGDSEKPGVGTGSGCLSTWNASILVVLSKRLKDESHVRGRMSPWLKAAADSTFVD